MPAPLALVGVPLIETVALIGYLGGMSAYAIYRHIKKNKSKGVFNIGLWGRKESGKTTLLNCLGANLPPGQTRRAMPFNNVDLSYENQVRTVSINADVEKENKTSGLFGKSNQKSHDVPGDKSFKFLLKMQQQECLNLFIYIFDINNYFNHDKDESDNGAGAVLEDLYKLNEVLKDKEESSNVLLLGTHIDELEMTEAEVQKAFRESLDGKKYKHIAKNLSIVNLNDEENSKNEILRILNSNNVFGEKKNEE